MPREKRAQDRHASDSTATLLPASAGASSSQAEPHLNPYPDFSSSSQAADARAVWCDGGDGEEVDVDVLNLDSPWVSAAEAESILEEAAVAAGLFPGPEKDAQIRANQERQEDEVRRHY